MQLGDLIPTHSNLFLLSLGTLSQYNALDVLTGLGRSGEERGRRPSLGGFGKRTVQGSGGTP